MTGCHGNMLIWLQQQQNSNWFLGIDLLFISQLRSFSYNKMFFVRYQTFVILLGFFFLVIQLARSKPAAAFGGMGIFNFGGNKLGRGSCFGYFAYRKMIAVKVVFINFLFLGTKKKFGAAPTEPPWLRACNSAVAAWYDKQLPEKSHQHCTFVVLL